MLRPTTRPARVAAVAAVATTLAASLLAASPASAERPSRFDGPSQNAYDPTSDVTVGRDADQPVRQRIEDAADVRRLRAGVYTDRDYLLAVVKVADLVVGPQDRTRASFRFSTDTGADVVATMVGSGTKLGDPELRDAATGDEVPCDDPIFGRGNRAQDTYSFFLPRRCLADPTTLRAGALVRITDGPDGRTYADDARRVGTVGRIPTLGDAVLDVT